MTDSAPIAPMPELHLLAPSDVDQVAALVFELAAQLHVERQRRLALEETLVRRGVVERDELALLARDKDFRDAVAEELARAQRGLLDVLLETDDARVPLRATARPESEGRHP